MSKASWEESCSSVYSNSFWWAPKPHKPHSLFTCPLQLRGQSTPHSQEAFQCLRGCRYISWLPHSCLVPHTVRQPSIHWHCWESSSLGLSAVRSSNECALIRDPHLQWRAELPHILGNLEDKRDVGLERAFPHPQSCDPQPGSRIAAPRFWPIVLHSSTTWGSSQLSQQVMLGYSLSGIPQGDFSEGWFTEV